MRIYSKMITNCSDCPNVRVKNYGKYICCRTNRGITKFVRQQMVAFPDSCPLSEWVWSYEEDDSCRIRVVK